MKRGKSPAGLNPTNEISREAGRIAYNKILVNVSINDQWRKAVAEDPSLPYRMTFAQFRKKRLRKG